MTDKIQELENTVLSHHLLQDHDKINQGNTKEVFKGVLEPQNTYCLDSFDIMGHRNPLYLRSLIDALAQPARARQPIAMNMLQTTIELVRDKMAIHERDYSYAQVTQEACQISPTVDLWRSSENGEAETLTSQESKQLPQIKVQLPCGLALTFSKDQKIAIGSAHEHDNQINMVNLLYQQKITTLFYEQKFFTIRIPQLIKQVNDIFQAKTQGLYLKLPDDFESSQIHFYQDRDLKKWLLFPIAITQQQLKDIKEIIGEL